MPRIESDLREFTYDTGVEKKTKKKIKKKTKKKKFSRGREISTWFDATQALAPPVKLVEIE